MLVAALSSLLQLINLIASILFIQNEFLSEKNLNDV